MEDGLRVAEWVKLTAESDPVLILVLVEDGLRERRRNSVGRFWSQGLNPCSCGRWSQSRAVSEESPRPHVLILVLVEDGLREILECYS